MCYFLYGAVNKDVNSYEYDKAIKNSKYRFNYGTSDDLNTCVENCNNTYRITVGCCDCNTAIGKKDVDQEELKDFEELLLNLKNVRGIKHILLSKNWALKTNSKQETVHIDDIDILFFLANIEDNCLYKIELYPRYY